MANRLASLQDRELALSLQIMELEKQRKEVRRKIEQERRFYPLPFPAQHRPTPNDEVVQVAHSIHEEGNGFDYL